MANRILTLRPDPEIRQRLAEYAHRTGRSINAAFEVLITDALDLDDAHRVVAEGYHSNRRIERSRAIAETAKRRQARVTAGGSDA